VEYAFRHPLTQEVAYASQLGEARARAHGAVARAISELDAGRLDERAALLAHHWEQTGDTLEAARWHARAAGWAGLLHPAASITHWRRLRELLDAADETRETIALGLAARIQILFQAERMGASEGEAAALLAEGRELARRGGDTRSLTLLLAAYSRYAQLRGGLVEGHAAIREAAQLAEEIGDPGLEFFMLAGLAMATLVLGRLAEAERMIEAAVALAGGDSALGTGHLPINPHGQLLMWRAMLLAWMGRTAEARDQLDRAVARMREVGDLPSTCALLTYYPMIAEFSGETSGILERAGEAVEIAERVGSPLATVMAYSALGEAHNLRGEWESAARAIEHALGFVREHGVARVFEPFALTRLARALTGQGDTERALATARQAVDLAREHGSPQVEAVSRLGLVRVLLRRDGGGSRAAIEAELARAATLVEEMGARGYEPLLCVEHAELARLCGDAAGRERELREAHRLFSEMGGTGHAERLARELGLA
jgi:adenylate cyclase